MQLMSNFVKVTIPNYLAGLPIPDSIGGWFRLSVRDWLSLVPPTVVLGGISYGSYRAYQEYRAAQHVNSRIRKDIPKVVDFVDIEDIMDKATFCRCWKTKNWPYCDGAHAAHNTCTGDNVGPIIVRHKPKA